MIAKVLHKGKPFFSCLVVAVMMLCFSAQAWALTTLEITAQTVNIRAGAGTNYAVVKTAALGDKFTVTGEKNGWYQIKIDGIENAWVIATYVKVNSVNDLPSYVQIQSGSVNIRAGAGTDYDKVATLVPGHTLPVLDLVNDWYKVDLGNQQTGWIASWLVDVALKPSLPQDKPEENTPPSDNNWGDSGSPYKKAIVNTGSLNVRSGASSSGAVVGVLTLGTQVDYLERSGAWIKIKSDSGLIGWVSASYIKFADVFVSSANVTAQNNLIWNASGVTAGQVNFSSQSMPFGYICSLKSDNVLNYSIVTENNKITINTDMVISGNSLNSNITATIEGQQKNALQITAQQKLYYYTKISSDRKQLDIYVGTSAMVGKKIFIDPGHGVISSASASGVDSGAVGANGTKEKDVTLNIAKKVAALAKNQGADVYLTRGDAPSSLSLNDRAWLANSSNADVFVSIHANANNSRSVNGTTTYFYAPNSNYNRTLRSSLATCVQKAVVESAGRKNLGVREDNFAVIRETTMTSVLVETAFISNLEEEALFNTDDFCNKLAVGITQGIQNYFTALNN